MTKTYLCSYVKNNKVTETNPLSFHSAEQAASVLLNRWMYRPIPSRKRITNGLAVRNTQTQEVNKYEIIQQNLYCENCE